MIAQLAKDKPIFAALDTDDIQKAETLVRELKNHVGGFKVGPRLVLRAGSDWVKKIASQAPLFFDFKFYDIPSTMVAAVKAAQEMGAQYVTVHASSGSEALKNLAELEQQIAQKDPFRILAVTILTSFNQNTLPPTQTTSIPQQVTDLAKATLQSGLTGLVCSPQEIELVRPLSKDLYIVTPGVRSAKDAKGDQQRVATAAEALQKGASALVIGRPIIEAANPAVAAEEILKSIHA